MANLHFRKKKIAEFHGILDFLLIFEFSRLFLNATLRVKNVKKTDDVAVYQCKAENIHGSVWANFYLNIVDHSN